MSTSLRDFLKEKGAHYAAESEKNREVVEEWREAVERLFNRLEEWLRAADPGKFIQLDRSRIEVIESGLGRYAIDRLNLRAFEKWVGVIPKARKTAKSAPPRQHGTPMEATGRVDITDEIRRYVLYRFGRGADEQ